MNVGEKIAVKEFNYTNLSGGTGSSDPLFFGEGFPKTAEIIITKIWDDYETGIRGWGAADPDDKELVTYLKKNCKQGHNRIFDTGKGYNDSEWVDQEGEFIMYWSEWDIINPGGSTKGEKILKDMIDEDEQLFYRS